MTREEEIKKAVDIQFPKGLGERTNEQALAAAGFELGVKWADEHPNLSSLWHNTSEEPKDCSKLLIYFEHEYGKMDCKIYHHVYWTDLLWIEVVNLYHIKQWAYISDLLPK